MLRCLAAVKLVLIVGLFLPGIAFAQVVTVQQPAGGAAGGIADSARVRGQVVRVPPAVGRLNDFTLRLLGNVTPQVRAWDNNSQTVGEVLFSGTPLVNAAHANVTTSIPAGGIAVTPSGYIWIGVAQNAPGQTGSIAVNLANSYPDGVYATLQNGVTTSLTTVDAYFIANFGPEPPAIPTLSEWAKILFGLGIAASAAVHIQRRSFTVGAMRG